MANAIMLSTWMSMDHNNTYSSVWKWTVCRAILCNLVKSTEVLLWHCKHYVFRYYMVFLAHDAFIRTNCCTMPRCSVCSSGTGMNCDHMVHASTDLSIWLDSPMFWAPWHQSMSTYSQLSCSSFTWKTDGGMDVQTRCDISRTVEYRC